MLAWPQLPSDFIVLDLISFNLHERRRGKKILARRTKGPGNGMQTCSTFVLPVIHRSGNWTWLLALYLKKGYSLFTTPPLF